MHRRDRGGHVGAVDLTQLGLSETVEVRRLRQPQIPALLTGFHQLHHLGRHQRLGDTKDRHLIARHVFQNVFPVIFANTILQVALMIILESSLSFLGIGNPTSVSWGSTLEKAFAAGAPTLGAWWWIGFPGLCIVLVVLAFTMCGNAAEEIVNPRLQQR